jgi:diaminohydroxyphosphoribosylaminopyrimidine deaminase/5-amino-6-(5-phosphoribosylamino)uracil reductase
VSTDEQYMMRCVQLAKLGERRVAPNPLVGAVVVHNDSIIGEGYHQEYGGPHAEVNAVNSVEDQSLLSESTLYVSLEPCSHHGKTPPCSDLIVSKKFRHVIIGCTDPFDKVAGSGIQHLIDNDIQVTTGICEKECKEINKHFFTFHQKKRPYVTLKWAETKDGYIDKGDKNEKVD